VYIQKSSTMFYALCQGWRIGGRLWLGKGGWWTGWIRVPVYINAYIKYTVRNKRT